MDGSNFDIIQDLANLDVAKLREAQVSYGDSWRNRGGVGAFMMLARKFDRIENQSEKHGWDVFKAGDVFTGDEGLLDDIRDLRRYLILVENELVYGEDVTQTTEEGE